MSALLRQLVFRELPLIQKIVADETWLEGERRGRWVSADDPVVKANVCGVILRVGAELRAAVWGQVAAPEDGAIEPMQDNLVPMPVQSTWPQAA